jgi:hypothetical protein
LGDEYDLAKGATVHQRVSPRVAQHISAGMEFIGVKRGKILDFGPIGRVRR